MPRRADQPEHAYLGEAEDGAVVGRQLALQLHRLLVAEFYDEAVPGAQAEVRIVGDDFEDEWCHVGMCSGFVGRYGRRATVPAAMIRARLNGDSTMRQHLRASWVTMVKAVFMVMQCLAFAGCGSDESAEPEPVATVGCVAGTRQVTRVSAGVWRGRAQVTVRVLQDGELVNQCTTLVFDGLAAESEAAAYAALEDQVTAYFNSLP